MSPLMLHQALLVQHRQWHLATPLPSTATKTTTSPQFSCPGLGILMDQSLQPYHCSTLLGKTKLPPMPLSSSTPHCFFTGVALPPVLPAANPPPCPVIQKPSYIMAHFYTIFHAGLFNMFHTDCTGSSSSTFSTGWCSRLAPLQCHHLPLSLVNLEWGPCPVISP